MKKTVITCASLVGLIVALGCGGNGASNNDQGVSVSFLGLFASLPTSGATGGGTGGVVGTTGCAQLPTSISGGYISLGQTAVDAAATPAPVSSGLTVDPSGAVYAVVGLQNNLYGQFFRADRVLLEYYVAGAKVQPPSTNVAVNMLAGPAESGQNTTGTTGGTTGGTAGGTTAGGTTAGNNSPNATIRRPIVTSLPPAFNQVCNRSFASIPIVPSPILEWLNFNQAQLPGVPFDMEVIVKLSGLSSSGNRYETNAGAFSFTVISDIQVNPTTSSTPTTQSAPLTAESGAQALDVGEDDSGSEDETGLDELESAFDVESSTEG